MKRYEFHTEWGGGEMIEDPNGEYVTYEDATNALVTEIKKKWQIEDDLNQMEDELMTAKEALRDLLDMMNGSNRSICTIQKICKWGLGE